MIAILSDPFFRRIDSCKTAPTHLCSDGAKRKHISEPITSKMSRVAVNFVGKALFSTFKHFNKPNLISDDCSIFRLENRAEHGGSGTNINNHKSKGVPKWH